MLYCQRVGQYVPPGPGDDRMTCPALNALANHGFLPRNGKNIGLEQARQACITHFSLGEDVMKIVLDALSTQQFIGNPPVNPTLATFNRPQFHNIIEHDCSLTRNDFYFGDPITLNQTLLAQLLIPKNLTITDVARARAMRVKTSRSENPTFQWNKDEQTASAFECSLIAAVFGSGAPLYQVPGKYLLDFFLAERLPIGLGWKKPQQLMTMKEVGPILNQILNFTLL